MRRCSGSRAADCGSRLKKNERRAKPGGKAVSSADRGGGPAGNIAILAIDSRCPATRNAAASPTSFAAIGRTAGAVASVRRAPADPTARQLADPIARKPAGPIARKPADPTVRKPADPIAHQLAGPIARQPADLTVRDPRVQAAGDRADRDPVAGATANLWVVAAAGVPDLAGAAAVPAVAAGVVADAGAAVVHGDRPRRLVSPTTRPDR